MPHPSIGQFRHRLTLETATRLADGGGGATLTWSPLLDAWARISPRHGREIVTADQVTARVTHVIRIRHRPGILPAMRWRFGTRLFHIHAVLDVEEHRRWLDCLCEETA